MSGLVTKFWNRGFLVGCREMAPTASVIWVLMGADGSIFQVAHSHASKCCWLSVGSQSLTIWTSPWGCLRVFLACSQHLRERNPRMHSRNNGACYDPALKITDHHIHPFSTCMDTGAKDHQRLVNMKNQIETVAWKHTHYLCKTDVQWEFVVWHRELNPVLCDNLKGWDGMGDGRETLKGRDICIPMADSCCCMAESSTIL